MPKLNLDKNTSTYNSSSNNATLRAEGLSKSIRRDSSSLSVGESFGLFRLVVILIITLVLVRMLTGFEDNTITFQGFLDTLANTPRIDMSWAYSFRDLTIAGDWWPVDFIRVFLNTILSIVATLLFMAMGVVQAILFFVYFIGFIFG